MNFKLSKVSQKPLTIVEKWKIQIFQNHYLHLTQFGDLFCRELVRTYLKFDDVDAEMCNTDLVRLV